MGEHVSHEHVRDEIRDAVNLCRNTANIGCIKTDSIAQSGYTFEVPAIPYSFKWSPMRKIMIIGGCFPAQLTLIKGRLLIRNWPMGKFSLGHKSAQGLGEIMTRVGQIKNIDLPNGLTRLPDVRSVSG